MSDKEVQAGKTDTQSSKQSAQGKEARGEVKGELLTAVFQAGWGEVWGSFLLLFVFCFCMRWSLTQPRLALNSPQLTLFQSDSPK